MSVILRKWENCIEKRSRYTRGKSALLRNFTLSRCLMRLWKLLRMSFCESFQTYKIITINYCCRLNRSCKTIKMSKCSELCGLPLSMWNTSMRHCSICRIRTCPYNFALSRGEKSHYRCQTEDFREPFAREAGMDYLELRDTIESQFKKGMLWGTFGWVWWIVKFLTPY